MTPTPQALLSVSDKTGVVELARGLQSLGFTLLSTGGTARLLAQASIPVTEVGSYTGFPEMLDGRVKTLHPKVHGGILARRDRPEHLQALEQAGIGLIDLVVVNLYPFVQTIANPDCTLDEAIENIDIGGPTMVRAAAKNYQYVGIVTDPLDYGRVLEELRSGGGLTLDTRFHLARKAFSHTAAYDGAIGNYLTALPAEATGSRAARVEGAFPEQLNLSFQKMQDLRYGENPHQRAAFYRDMAVPAGTLSGMRQLQGKELSYNNLADADAAWECVKGFDRPACVIVKHANPCGVALGEDLASAYRGAFACDPTSAFGGIIAFNRPLDETAARALLGQFVEVVLAPSVSAEAASALATKAGIRVLEIPGAGLGNVLDYKRIGGGLLVQGNDGLTLDPTSLRVVTRRRPTPEQVADLLFAWRVAQYVKSNAIVFCGEQRTLGIGAGQMSRVDSARIAGLKAAECGLSLNGSVVASDAFFPFRDGLDTVVKAGAVAVIQPGGSVRDEEVIAAADEQDVAMMLTGVRHFRH